MFHPVPVYVGLRYVVSRSRGFFVSFISWISMAGICVGVAALIMIPTTFIAGMTLPIMTHTLLRRADERAIGRVYASNTVGAIAGVLIAVHLLEAGRPEDRDRQHPPPLRRPEAN